MTVGIIFTILGLTLIVTGIYVMYPEVLSRYTQPRYYCGICHQELRDFIEFQGRLAEQISKTDLESYLGSRRHS